MNNIALVFPGQGSQYVGMTKDLPSPSHLLDDYFAKASNIFGVDLLSYCHNGPDEDLNSTFLAQPAIFVHSIIIDHILKFNGIKVKAVAGHSLGEYSALVSSGVLSFDDCLKILKVRCLEMQKANEKYKGSMLAIIHNDLNLIEEVCSNLSNTVIANINSDNQIIISGPSDQIDKSINLFRQKNIKRVIKLNVSGAFHSPLMNEANLSLNKVINSVNFSDTSIAVYQNTKPIENFDGKRIKQNLLKQLIGSVLWYDIIINMKKNNIDTIIEVGPKQVLSKLVKKISPNIKTLSIDKFDDLLLNGFKVGS
jgi:[acyl-carrier-protein] S-malonyltransferase